MRIAYLLFAYKNPQLIERVIKALSCDDSYFYLHVDQKSPIEPFLRVAAAPRVFCTEERIPVYWAEFSGVRAMLLLMEKALSHPPLPDYLVLLSGSDYPLRSKEYIHHFLEKHRGSEFINMVRIPNEEAGKPLSRINTLRIESHRPVARLVVRGLAKAGLAGRDHTKHLGALKPYAGNTWWALTRYAVQYILDFVEQNPRICAFFEDTFAPEEMFFHTILGNSVFRSRVRRNLMYEDWSARGGHPAPIGPAHLELFEKSERVVLTDVYGAGEVLFARKFTDESAPLLLRIDRLVERCALPA